MQGTGSGKFFYKLEIDLPTLFFHARKAHFNRLFKLENASVFVVSQAQCDRIKAVLAIKIFAANKAFETIGFQANKETCRGPLRGGGY